MKRYKLFCETDSKYEYVSSSSEPTTCPVDAGHTVRADSVSLAEVADVNQDYRILGYHKKLTIDTKGDLTVVEFFKDYDDVNDIHSTLMVKEERTYTRDAGSGLMTKRDITITWYDGSGNVIDTKAVTKYYDANQGYIGNQRSRNNLVNKASMWLLADLQTEYGVTVGEDHGQEFLRDVKNEISTYTRGDISELINAISASARSYMTAARKNTLDSLLNISYP